MTTPWPPASEGGSGRQPGPDDGVDLTKPQPPPEPEAPFDPYRFGRPDHPVPPEFAPPGYVPDEPPPPAYQPPPGSYGQQYGAPPPPYGQQYGAPPPPAYHAYGQPRGGNGKAIAALVLGIGSIVLFWFIVFDAVPIILALIFGIIALNESRSRNGSGRGMAIAGIVCCLVGAVATVVFTVAFMGAVNKCGGLDSRNESGFQQCVQDHWFGSN